MAQSLTTSLGVHGDSSPRQKHMEYMKYGMEVQCRSLHQWQKLKKHNYHHQRHLRGLRVQALRAVPEDLLMEVHLVETWMQQNEMEDINKIGGGKQMRNMMTSGGGMTPGKLDGMVAGQVATGKIQHGANMNGLSRDVMTIKNGDLEVQLETTAQARVLGVLQLPLERSDPMQGRHWSLTSTARPR